MVILYLAFMGLFMGLEAHNLQENTLQPTSLVISNSEKKQTLITIHKGLIELEHNCAIVNAANPFLSDGAGVCGAIFKAAGREQLAHECQNIPCTREGIRCPAGEARITSSHNLKERGISHIIHAVGPDGRIIRDPKEQKKLLASTCQHALTLATKKNITRVAFPFISSGIYSVDARLAAQTMIQSIATWLEKHRTSITSVTFVLLHQWQVDLFSQLLAGYDHNK